MSVNPPGVVVVTTELFAEMVAQSPNAGNLTVMWGVPVDLGLPYGPTYVPWVMVESEDEPRTYNPDRPDPDPVPTPTAEDYPTRSPEDDEELGVLVDIVVEDEPE